MLAQTRRTGFCQLMEVFVTGGSGTIGQAVVGQLIEDGCKIVGLSRSDASADTLRRIGATVFPGDLSTPEDWAQRAVTCDAVVHLGATFQADMGPVDRNAMFALRKATRGRGRPLKLLYTGGIWLYPSTPERYALKETTAHEPLAPFSQMSETIRSLMTSVELQVSVIHPALVCSKSGGPVSAMGDAAISGLPFKTRATEETVWPLVEASDLARLYSRVLRRQGFRLNVFGAGVSGVPVGGLIEIVNEQLGTELQLETILPTDGLSPAEDWEAGYALSQYVNTERAQKLSGWVAEHQTAESLVAAVLGK